MQKKISSFILIIVLAVSCVLTEVPKITQAKTVYTVKAGQSMNIYIYRGKIKSCYSNRSWIASVKKTGKHKVRVKGKSQGKAKITIRTTKGKVKVIIKVKRKKSSSTTETWKPVPRVTIKPTTEPAVSTPSPKPTSVSETVSTANVSVSLQRMTGGRILVTVKNNNKSDLYQYTCTIDLYDSKGNFLDSVDFSKKYIPGNGESYGVYSPDEAFEKMDPSKVQIKDAVITPESTFNMIQSGIKSNITEGTGYEKGTLYLELENNTEKTAYVNYIVLFYDASKNLVDARSSTVEILPRDKEEDEFTATDPYHLLDKTLSYSSYVLYLRTGDTA